MGRRFGVRHVIFWTLCCLYPLALCAQQSAFHQEVFTQARGGARIPSGLETGYHQIAWDTSGRPGLCHIGLDYSNDGLVWYLGQVINLNDCEHSGHTIIAGPQHVHFVRMRVASLAPSGTIRATYTGWQGNPVPPGTVTSVFGRTGAVQAVAGDYDVSLITGAAPLFSPIFTGTPQGPTPPPTDNSTALATTAWVQQFVGTPTTGTVSNFSAGNLSPLFTTSVATASTTPALSFTLSNAPAGTMLGNSGSGSAAPSWIPIPTPGTPGGSSTALDFGGTIFSLGATAPTEGQCLLRSGSSIVGGACGTSGGGGTVGPGTVGHLPKFATTTTLSDSNLSDDGTTLNYTGSGGVTASSFSVPTGNMQWSSVTGAVPSPVAGRNQLVSGPDGWYVSDNGGAFTGPIGAGGGGGGGPGPSTGLIFGSNPTIPLGTNNPGTGQFLTFNGTQIVGAALPVPTSLNFGSGAGPGTTIPLGAAPTSGQFLAFDGTNLVGVPAPGGSNPGVTSFNERDGAVFPAEGDYDVTQVTGAAPLNSPGFVGRPTAPEPDPNDDSNQIATTSWVLAHGGGGQPQPPPQPLPVAPSPVQGLACNSSSAAVTRLNILNLTLQAGDAVFVFIIASGQNNTISNVSDNSGVLGATVPNTYSARVSANITQSGYHSRWIWSSGIPTAPQITHNASVVHVDFGGSYSNSLACVVVYTGVATLGASQTFPPTGGVVSHTLSRTAVNAGDVMLGQFVASNSSWAAGGAWTPAGVGLGALQTIGGSVAMRLCRNTATTAAENLSCTWTNTGGGNIPVTGGALLLEGGVVAPPPVVFTGPKVIKYVHAQFTAGTSQSTPQTICSSTACPIGIYRLSHYLNVQTACSSGGSIQLHLQFHDLTSAKTWSVPGTALPITSTTAEFHGDQPFTFKSDGTNAITYTYTAAACSGGTGTGTIQLVLEELVGPEEVQ